MLLRTVTLGRLGDKLWGLRLDLRWKWDLDILKSVLKYVNAAFIGQEVDINYKLPEATEIIWAWKQILSRKSF